MAITRHQAGVSWPIMLAPMATARISGTRQGRHGARQQAADEARERGILDQIVARDRARRRSGPAAHVAHLSVRERYLAFLRGGNDQRVMPFGAPFGSEHR